MADIQLIEHAPSAPGLRFLGLGPNLIPRRGLGKLRELFNKNTFWAKGRKDSELKRMLIGSTVVISAWRGSRMVGFGRATSDGIYRAVLWDVVVPSDLQGLGIGRKVIEALLNSTSLKDVERIYLMTTNCQDFYQLLGFNYVKNQKLMMVEKS